MKSRLHGIFVWVLTACLLTPALAATDPEILRPEQAFRYTTASAPGEILIQWAIEPGYYLYRERMSVSGKDPVVRLGDAIFPPGEIHTDEFFGAMETYRGQFTVRVPVQAVPPGQREIPLELRLQGCADAGLCYPPQKWAVSAPAPAMSAQPPARGLPEAPLPVDQAFRASVIVLDPFTLEIRWEIQPGYYLYRDSLGARSLNSSVQSGNVQLPAGTAHTDENFGATYIFPESFSYRLSLSRSSPKPALAELELSYQGCKTESICYPPATTLIAADLPAASTQDQPLGTQPVSEQDRLSAVIANSSLPGVMLLFVGLGLLLSFTPCVLPLVPIISSIVAGQGPDITTRRAFMLSLAYVLGMAVTYTLAGALVGAAGQQVQAIFQKPWIIIGVAGLFVALALAMFGLYELQLPAGLQTRLSALGDRQRGKGLTGTALMGVLSALVVTTCVAPPLVAALTVIAQSGSVLRGAAALFALSIGMGLPLLVIGTSAGKLLPKAGAWMVAVKSLFGFMMLGLAVWMLDRILPPQATMLLTAVLVFGAGIFLLASFRRLHALRFPMRTAGQACGVLLALYGAVLMVGGLAGSTSLLQPLAGLGNSAVQNSHLEFRAIKSVADLDRELAAARGKNVMLDFYADWCVSCKEMEHFTFSDAAVQTTLKDFVLLQADVTANDELDQELMKHFGIFGPPTIIYFGQQGAEITGQRVVGYLPPAEFIAHIRRAVVNQ